MLFDDLRWRTLPILQITEQMRKRKKGEAVGSLTKRGIREYDGWRAEKVLDEAPDDLEIFYISDVLVIPLEEAWVEKDKDTGEAEEVLLNTYL